MTMSARRPRRTGRSPRRRRSRARTAPRSGTCAGQHRVRIGDRTEDYPRREGQRRAQREDDRGVVPGRRRTRSTAAVGRRPSPISLRVLLSIAAIWSASKAWRPPRVYAVTTTPRSRAPWQGGSRPRTTPARHVQSTNNTNHPDDLTPWPPHRRGGPALGGCRGFSGLVHVLFSAGSTEEQGHECRRRGGTRRGPSSEDCVRRPTRRRPD